MTVLRLYIWWSNPAREMAENAKIIARKFTRFIPWIERSKYMLFKAFLESDLTLKDMAVKLGKRRPSDVAKMLTVITPNEARTGYWMDSLEGVLEFTFEMKLIKFVDMEAGKNIPHKIAANEPFDEREEAFVASFIRGDGSGYFPQLPWPGRREWQVTGFATLRKPPPRCAFLGD